MTSKQLRQWRKRNGYSQSQLARALGVDVMTVSRWEREIRAIPTFLHLALECMEKKGDRLKVKGTKKKRERQVRK